MNRQVGLGLLACLALGIVGCGGAPSNIAKTTGKVTYQGASVEGATVTMSTQDNSKIATAITDGEGNFTMMTQVGQKSYEGAPLGSVNVTITKFADMGTGDVDSDDPSAVDEMYSQMLDQQGDGEGSIETTNELPGKYAATITSGLTATIEADPEKNVFTFDLEDE